MGAKKVGTITLEHENADGVMESNAYDAEFHNALITGDISMLEGTFSGKLTTDAVDALHNINLAGGSVAITYIADIGTVTKAEVGFTDDSVYRYVAQIAIEVPEDMNGAWCAVAIQYRIDDTHGDNDYFPCRYKLMVDSQQYFRSASANFSQYYDHFNYHLHELLVYLSGPGIHTVGVMYAWGSAPTSVYPRFYNVLIRADLFRK